MSILKKYNRHLLKRGYNGPLNFSQKFQLGHIITFDRRSGFEIIGHISNEFFKLQNFTPIEKSGTSEVDIDFGAETGVNIELKLKGDAPIANSRLSIEDTGMVIEFENKASYLLKTAGTKVHYIENIAELGKLIKNLYKSKKWNRKWFVITNLIEADRSTLLISRTSNSKIELKAKASVESITDDDLVSVDTDFSFISKKGMNTNIIGKEGPYFPLFKANGIKVRRLFPGPIGADFETLRKVNAMNTFTISELEKRNSNYELNFEEYNFDDELLDDDEVFLT